MRDWLVNLSARPVGLLVVVFVLLTLSACGGEGSNLGASCEQDSDCGDGLACNSLGQCITVECLTDQDCEVGYACSEAHTCQAIADGDSDSGCTSDSGCPEGFFCVPGGFCMQDENYCFSTSDCPIGYYCDRNHECQSRSGADVDLPSDGDDPDGDLIDGDSPADGDGSGDGDVEEEEPPLPDRDNDGLPDEIEDRNGNGIWDQGSETDPDNPDTDNDGIKDGVEDANHDGIRQLNETDPLNRDSDYDKLFDGLEDANYNGVVDEGETDPRNPDTDDDGVIDGNELAGTYSYHNQSNPLSKDTDGDTLPDGVEDANGNGVYEPELGETDPTLVDSDDDSVPDNEESVTQICLADQVTVVTLHDSPSGDWTLALLPDFDYVYLNLSPNGSERLAVAMFEDSANEIAGFIVSRDPDSQVVENQVSADNALMVSIPTDSNLNHRGRTYISPDEFEAMTSHYTLTVASQSVGAVRKKLLEALIGRSVSAVDNLPAGPSESSDRFEVLSETLVRDDNVLTLMAVVTKARYDNASANMARIRLTDLTDGSAISKSQKGTDNSCDPFRGTDPAVTDILWVVDDSGSMSEDQQAVADAASLFAQIMTTAGVDFRVAVTSTDCNDGTLGSAKFTTNMSQFQNNVQDPPCASSEYGLRAGWAAINKALNTSLPENERWRAESSKIVVFLSDEEDQEYEDCEPIWPWDPPATTCQAEVLSRYKDLYDSADVTCFAIVGDIPSGCGGGSEGAGAGSGEAGTAYVDLAYHTGGSFGSICSPDLTPTMEEILRAAAGAASIYEMVQHPITSTLQVMIEGVAIPRDPSNGFEYDGVSNTVVFYGDSRPSEGDDVVISYRYFEIDPKPDK
jgi:hypothetical protein